MTAANSSTAAASPLRTVDLPASPDSWPKQTETFLRDLGGPSWISIPGLDRSRSRIVSTLLHGNEPSGTRAMLAWLRSGAVPAVDTHFLIASIEAALEPPGFAHRMRFGERDLNRCFLPPFQGREGDLALDVLGRVRSLRPEALVDLHNTTGHTPAYGVGPRSDPARLGLTAFFADRYVESDLKLGALIEAVQDEVPAVVIECGRTGAPEPDRVALEGLSRFLATDRPLAAAGGSDDANPPKAHGMSIVASPVRVCLQPGLNLHYGASPAPDADLTVDEAVDRHNFEWTEAGTTIGWLGENAPWPLVATRADGAEVSPELFEVRGRELVARTGFVPIMMTTDPEIAVQDCIFYAATPRDPASGETG